MRLFLSFLPAAEAGPDAPQIVTTSDAEDAFVLPHLFSEPLSLSAYIPTPNPPPKP